MMKKCLRRGQRSLWAGVLGAAAFSFAVVGGAQTPMLSATAVMPKLPIAQPETAVQPYPAAQPYPASQPGPAAQPYSGAQPEPAAAAQAAEPQIKDDLFTGTEKFAKGASDVTEVTMDPDALDMVKGSDAKRAHRMVLNVVRTYTYDKPGMYNVADVDEFRRKLESGDWRCSVHTRDLKSGESTDICNKRRGPDMVETAIITVAPKELTFIHTIRKIGAGESTVDPEVLSGIGLVGALPPAALIAMMRPEMDAEILGATAELRAQGTAMMHGFTMPVLPKLDGPRMEEQMKQFQEQMQTLKHLKLPAPDPKQMEQLQQQRKQLEITPQPQRYELR